MEVPLKHHFDCTTRQIRTADSLPALLSSAFMGLELIERAMTVLAHNAPADTRPSHQTALVEATDAWWALTEAPTLAWPAQPMTDAEAEQLSGSVAALVLTVAQALLNVASKTTEPGDRVACLRAAHHCGHVHAVVKK